MAEGVATNRPKILLLDDEQDLLDLYRQLLAQLSSQPEIITANSGARALALLENEPFTMLISDLRMPKMDGLQVLSIVRRKYPNLRIIVMTGITDEHFRSRAYAMGIDLFWQKPSTSQEIQLFLECIESLLEKEDQSGFRGVQSKSLVDLIQLECLSQSSSVLKITNGPLEGKIWILNGEIIDAATQEVSGEKAFHQILSWKTGNFEILPPEPTRTRTIHNSVHGLLLETVQSMDEAGAGETPGEDAARTVENIGIAQNSPLFPVASTKGVEFALMVSPDEANKIQSWRVENPEPVAKWSEKVTSGFVSLGELMKAGTLTQIEALGPQCHVALGHRDKTTLAVGLHRTLNKDQVFEITKTVLAKWES
jgi:CheY-like chemotaxis protein